MRSALRNRHFRTTSFRLTLLYASLFLGSVIIIFAIIYKLIPLYMTRELDTVVKAELADLVQIARQQDQIGLADTVSMRSGGRGSRTVYVLLQDARGNRLAGNLPNVPLHVGHVNLQVRPPGKASNKPHLIRGRAVRLSDGQLLLVGVDANQVS